MVRLFYFLGVTVLVVAFQNCAPSYREANHANHAAQSVNAGGNNSGNLVADLPPGSTVTSDPALQTQALGILSNKCASCHQDVTSGGITQILNVNHLIASGLIVPGNPNQGVIVGSITAGRMPLGGTISAAEIQTIKDWISTIVVSGGAPIVDPVVSPLPSGKTVQVDSALHARAVKILNVNCGGCHQSITTGGITNILDVNHLVASGLVVAGDATKGRVVAVIQDGSMPSGSGARVTAADFQTLKDWINSLVIVNDTGQPKPSTRPALSSTFTGIFANIIEPKCVGCHGPVLARAGKRFDTFNAVKNSLGDIISECVSGGMPRAPYPQATADEIAALRAWSAAGAPNN